MVGASIGVLDIAMEALDVLKDVWVNGLWSKPNKWGLTVIWPEQL
jgi:hypothetical protein